MIVPIVKKINGEDQSIGAAHVSPDGENVEYFFKPGYTMAAAVTNEMTKQLRKLATRR